MHKISRKQLTVGARRKDRPRKRRQSFNPKDPETDDSSFTSTSAKKLKGDDKEHVPEEDTLQYSIIDFALVFSTLSSFVRCSNIIDDEHKDQLCNGKVQFKQCSKFGLGYKIVVECERCDPKYILSCQKIGRMYELNRRFIFVMRILGLGLAGCKKFCGLMDISSSFLNQPTYDFYIDKIHECIETVTQTLFSSAAEEEKQFTNIENDLQDTTDVSVSGDGTWKKHEYTPLPDEVLIAMKPIYDDLSKDELLERCVGGFTQNNNESFNQLIWKITPKILPAGSKIVNIAALVAACIFNEGTSALLLIMHGMDLKLGRNSHEYARISDENRVCAAEKKSASETREARIRHRQEQKDALDIATAAGSLLYGPGIDDSL
ncbi:uncharacterized protein LOC123258969 [Cotesia glomerata]|uniref:uncharacterized protein LOC123258969 n=1 Tax=Cotesia glomerata TaxID=32391 RepID=UPI001D02BF33|nr:uncharacterized protein LOC123258969 [Cotesia glomerata]